MIRSFLVNILITSFLFVNVNVFAQTTLLSWPLSSDYNTVVYNTNDLDNASYSLGIGVNTDPIGADGGYWWDFTSSLSIDEDDYVQMELTPVTGGGATDIYLTSIEFNIKQSIWFSFPGPSMYALYYSKNADFSNASFIDGGNLTTNFSTGDVNFLSPITVFSGETIYFRIFGYEADVNGNMVLEDNQFLVKGYVETAASINPVPSLSFAQNCVDDGNLIFDLPSSFNSNNQTILIFAKEGSPINYGSPTALLSAYPTADNNLTTFSGSSYEHDANAKLVYKGTSAGPQYLSGMSTGTDYYFLAYNVKNNGGASNTSGGSYGDGSVSGAMLDLSAYSAIGTNQSVYLSFTAPSCVDAIMIVAKEGSINASPSGDGSAYTADPNYLGGGTSFDGGKVVYNTTHTSGSSGNVTVTSLTNETQYNFKAFVRKGSVWSNGIELTSTPDMAPIVFTQSQANGSDFFEFITLERQDLSAYNITDQGVCASGAVYRSFSEWEAEDFFNSSGNGDVTNPLVDVPAGTYVKVYSGNTTVDVDFSDGLITLRNSNLNLSGSGDQVMVYTGNLPGPFEDCGVSPNPILAGINFADANDWITSGIPNDNTSYKPSTTAAFATLSSRGRSRYKNNTNLIGDSAFVLAGLVSPANWQHQNNTADYWKLKKIKFNQSDYSNGEMTFSNVSSTSFDVDASALSFTQATRSTRYLVVVNENASPDNPKDRYSCYNVTNDYSTTDDVVKNVTINYSDGNPCGTAQTLGIGKVVYFDYDLPTVLTVSGLSGCTTYQVAVYAVNGNGVTSNFGVGKVNQTTTSTSGPAATIYYSQQSGVFSGSIWDDVSAGSPSALPTLSPCLKLVVQTGHTVTMDSTASFGELEIEAGGTLQLGMDTISLQRNLTINGSLNSDVGKFIMNGSDGQQIITTNSEIIFYDLEVNKGSPTESNELLINGNSAIKHLLTVLAGDLTVQAGSTLRLVSDQADYAAALGPVPVLSSLTGEFIIERYLPALSSGSPAGSGSGWRFLSAPITSASFSTWDADIYTTGLIGSDNPNFPYNVSPTYYYYPSLQFYDESIPGIQDFGFDGDHDTILGPPNIRTRRNISQTIVPGQGVFVYVYSTPLTLHTKGIPFVGDLSVNINYTNNGLPLEDGWNLIANPYPSAIDWKVLNRSNGVGNFAYIYDAESSNFIVFDALASGDQFIASSNAFWVKTSQSGTINFEESDKVLDVTTPFYKNADEAFNEVYINVLNIGDSTLNDFARLRFMYEASEAYDVLYDAPKRYSLNPYAPGISTMIDSNDFAINSYNLNDSIVSIPLKANIRSAGSYQFSFDLAGDYLDEKCMVLHDLQTDEMFVVEQDAIYSFESSINEINDSARFELIFRPTVKIFTKNASCYGGENGEIDIESYGDGPFTYTVFDANAEEVVSMVEGSSLTIDGLAYGFYTLQVDGLGGECATIQREFFIGQPAASTTHELIAYNTECQGGYKGEIQVSLSDSLLYDLRLYNDDVLLESHDGVRVEDYFSKRVEGTYRVDIINACDSVSYYTTVATNDSMLIDFELSADTVFLQDGGEVYCQNTSENASSYDWFFTADQTEPFTEENGEHIYTEAGSYDIYLFGKSQSACQQYINKSITVIDLTSRVDDIEQEDLWTQIRYSSENIELHYKLNSNSLTLQIVNELGQVITTENLNASSGIYNIDTNSLKSGIYFIKLESKEGKYKVERFVVR